jgi:DNA polymerase I
MQEIFNSFVDSEEIILQILNLKNSNKLIISDRINYKIIDLKNENLNLFQQFLINYTGIIYQWNSKKQYKLFLYLDTYLNNTVYDLLLASYLQNPEVKIIPNEFIQTCLDISKIDPIINIFLEQDASNEDFVEEGMDFEKIVDEICSILWRLITYLNNSLPEKVLYLWKEVESPLSVILGAMEVHGVLIDRNKLHQVANSLKGSSDKLRIEILQILDQGKININSPSQLGIALTNFGFELKKTGQSGKLSVDKNVLDELLLTDKNQLIQKILDYRTLTKLLSTYTENLIEQLDVHDRLHCTFNQHLTSTGRISSKNPNLQNIPIRNQEFGSRIRSCFIVKNGYSLVSADYSQIELRILTHFTEDPVLLEAFRLNQDIHKRTASEIFQISIEKVTSQQRSLGKTLNFALLYQQGAFATARQLGITMKDAEEFIKRYFEAFGTVKEFIKNTLDQAKTVGYSESLFGRRRYFKFLNSPRKILQKEDERAAFNMVLQGTNADLIKIAMIEIQKKIKTQNLDAKLILQVHDELVLEVKDEHIAIVKEIVRYTMSNPPMKLKVPLLIDVKSASNWSDC